MGCRVTDSRWAPVRPQQRHLPVLATLTLLALMYGMGLINYDGFSDTQVFLNVFVDNAFLLVVAVGMTFVILAGGIDLSVGCVVALTTVVAGAFASGGVAGGGGATAGAADRRDARAGHGLRHPLLRDPALCRDARRDVSRPGTVPPDQRFLDPITNGFWTQMAQQRLRFGGFFISISVVIAVIVVLVAAYVLAYTRLGRDVYALGDNDQSRC